MPLRLRLVRNIYFIQKNEEGEYVSGTIISDASAQIVSMAEDETVSLSRRLHRRIMYVSCCQNGCRVRHDDPPRAVSAAPQAE